MEHVCENSEIAVDQANAGADGVFGPAQALARYGRDVLGRVLTESDYDAQGQVAHSRSGIVYDNRNQVLSEHDTQRQGSDTYRSYVSNWYGATGLLSSTATQSWKDSSTTSNATTSYAYQWRDGALTSQVTLTNTDGTTHSTYGYDTAGRLTQVVLDGGPRPRTVSLTTDLNGEILTRDEAPTGSGAAALNPQATDAPTGPSRTESRKSVLNRNNVEVGALPSSAI